MPPEPRLAATVILVDDRAQPARVYLVKRHGRSGFMAGAHVFPGGRVDDADAALGGGMSAAARAACAAALPDVASEQAIALHVAAVRETFEECHVLLARDARGHDADRRMQRAIRAEVAGGRTFGQALAAHGLVPDVGALVPFAWWITPAEEPKRFDTRFFATAVPREQDASIDAHEVTEGEWLAPGAAIDRYASRSIALAPPTLATLEDLLGFGALDEVVARGPGAGRAICPRIVAGEDGLVLALPGDPLHDEKTPVFPGVRTRFVMTEDGRFQSRWGPT